jgi:hypothetical protein
MRGLDGIATPLVKPMDPVGSRYTATDGPSNSAIYDVREDLHETAAAQVIMVAETVAI